MKIHTGDQVTVIAGKDKGKQGVVTRVLGEKSRVIVEGINMRTRHIKKTPQAAGQRISYEASIHVSNVMILDPKTKKPTRIGYKIDPKTGHKSRIAKSSGEVIVKAVTKADKPMKKETKAAKEGKETKDETKTTTKTTEATTVAKPTKQPFWKRKSEGKGDDAGTGGDAGGSNVIQTAHRSQGG